MLGLRPWLLAQSPQALKRHDLVVRSLHQECGRKSRLVFLGTPEPAAKVLDSLLDAAAAKDSKFEIAGIVTQPPAARGRGKKQMPSLVAQRALDRQFPPHLIFSPEKASERCFLEELKSLEPDLCVTAAYGNILSQKFLDIPKHGTVNVHPSLLPLYRGAAPVQRAIQDGVKVTGVSVAYTVRALDSGPVVASESVEVDENIKAPELQDLLFSKGTCLLLREMPHLLDGTGRSRATEQDHSRATHAPKIGVEEAWLSFEEPAAIIHNKVRAFSEWPGTKAKFHLSSSNDREILEMKIVTTRVCQSGFPSTRSILLKAGSMLVECGDHSWLEILEVQPPGRKVMKARDFWNGLQGKELTKFYEEVLMH
ncbi:hypothetical protein SELMODRAFT_173020 [Selaginella moellendorffii]|uniref:Methionyl-tRNA formyltransferase, mitochondrial n=1 Tax=Selaginella moellendorffii TaxID=88036 RepID=D8RNT1_SELML|nr:uncharacterized protein LOC9636503 [Selaginella moellendorffii]EFJ26134.1 hypothetical protein SELMODRAFT_173020 [Selaginella moellendorffii]|eukprot:XP_002972913.1 uncharacterized protein LOC9636503 [Selaginella moellendorffii]